MQSDVNIHELAGNRMMNWLLYIGCVLCLVQVWLPAYFLTGDGPCHVYNAQVLHDMWTGSNTDLYSRYYELVLSPNPNWLSTIVIAALMFLVNGIVAEKIFLTVYVVLYVSGFYLLLKKIGVKSSYLSLIIFLFVFPQTLSKGFYNFSFSIAFYFWVVWAWLRCLDRKNIANVALFLLFTFFIFFTHLLAFCFAAVTCAALAFSYSFDNNRDDTNTGAKQFFFRSILLLGAMLTPFLVLMRWFTEKEGGMNMQLRPHLYRLIELVQFKYLVNVTHAEDVIVELIGIVLLVLFFFSFSGSLKFRVNKYDGFLYSLLFVLFVYLFLPESFLGRLILISMRAQVFVFVFMVLCMARMSAIVINRQKVLLVFVFLVAYCMLRMYALPSLQGHAALQVLALLRVVAMPFVVLVCLLLCIYSHMASERIVNASAFLLAGCFVLLVFVRTSCLTAASDAEKEYLSAAKHIKAGSVVLPLDFAPSGKNKNGATISDRNFLFYHGFQYAGLEKPLIILDNYEANMGYFPLSWKAGVSPYSHLAAGEGIEAQPPGAGIEAYKRNAGVNVDYVVMWCFDTSWLKNVQFGKLYREIETGYNKIYTSAGGNVVLFEKK